VGLGTFLADVLADLKLPELLDQPGAERDAQKQRGEARESRAHGSVAENAERAYVPVELFVEQKIEHGT
jgi:hypothetical protein